MKFHRFSFKPAECHGMHWVQPFRLFIGTLCLNLFFSSTLIAQQTTATPETASGVSPEDRLATLENIYQQEAAKIRRPHLESYLRDLQKLKSINSKNSELVALIDQEMLQIEISIKEGVPPAFESPNAPETVPTRIRGTGAMSETFEEPSSIRLIERTSVIRLRPDSIEGEPTPLNSTRLAQVIPQKLGQKEWMIETLPAGNYHIYLLFSHPDVTGGKLEFVLGAGKMVLEIDQEHLPVENKFKLWNVIEVPIPQEMSKVPFAVKYTPPIGEAVTLDLKSVYFTTRKL